MPVSPDPAFAEAFEQLRLGRGWTPAEVARRLDVYPTEVSRWRRGGGISINNVRKVADLFGADRAWLERLAGYPPNAKAELETDNDLLARAEAFKATLRGIPRAFWPAVTAAITSLADALPPSLPVSDADTASVSKLQDAANRGKQDQEPPLSLGYQGYEPFFTGRVTGFTHSTLAVSA